MFPIHRHLLVMVSTLAISIVMLAVSAHAAHFTKDEASRFIDTLPAIEAWGKTLNQSETASRTVHTNFVTPAINTKMPETPYSDGVRGLKMHDKAHYNTLTGLVKQHGFASAESWAHVGDHAMKALVAHEIKANPEVSNFSMNQIPAEARAFMPPAMLQQMEATQQNLKAMENVPADDLATITPLVPKFKRATK